MSASWSTVTVGNGRAPATLSATQGAYSNTPSNAATNAAVDKVLSVSRSVRPGLLGSQTLLGRAERLIEIGEDVVDMLYTD